MLRRRLRPEAHLWIEVWFALADQGLTPCEDDREGGLRIFKVKSHMTKKQREELGALEKVHVELNDDAGTWAKAGAKEARGVDWQLLHYKMEL